MKVNTLTENGSVVLVMGTNSNVKTLVSAWLENNFREILDVSDNSDAINSCVEGLLNAPSKTSVLKIHPLRCIPEWTDDIYYNISTHEVV